MRSPAVSTPREQNAPALPTDPARTGSAQRSLFGSRPYCARAARFRPARPRERCHLLRKWRVSRRAPCSRRSSFPASGSCSRATARSWRGRRSSSSGSPAHLPVLRAARRADADRRRRAPRGDVARRAAAASESARDHRAQPAQHALGVAGAPPAVDVADDAAAVDEERRGEALLAPGARRRAAAIERELGACGQAGAPRGSASRRARPRPPRRRSSRARAGRRASTSARSASARWHGPHQVAKKSTIVAPPSRRARGNGRPSSVSSSSAGARSPMPGGRGSDSPARGRTADDEAHARSLPRDRGPDQRQTPMMQVISEIAERDPGSTGSSRSGTCRPVMHCFDRTRWRRPSAGSSSRPSPGSHVPAIVALVAAPCRSSACPAHVPPVHVSPVVHLSPSLQPVPFVAAGFEQSPVPGSHVPAHVALVARRCRSSACRHRTCRP